MYAALDDLRKLISEDLIIQLTDDDGSGIINTTFTAAALETADVEIDGYLGARYPLPLSTVPAIIAKYAVDIAIYNLYARRQGPPEHWQNRYDNAISFLKRINDGRTSLGLGDPDPPAADEAQVSAGDRIFSRDTLSGY